MKAFTDEQALELGRSILTRFEEGLNGKKWKGNHVVLPIQLNMIQIGNVDYPFDTNWFSSVQLSIPCFFRAYGPGDYESITLDEWLNELKKKKKK